MGRILHFKLDNYHAVGHADIQVGGVTVIAGVNGCGKSTISRLLTYFLSSMSQFEYQNTEKLVNKINSFLTRFMRLGNPALSTMARRAYIQEKHLKLDDMQDIMYSVINLVHDTIITQVLNGSELQRRRILSLFDIEYQGEELIGDVINKVEGYLERHFQQFKYMYDDIRLMNEERKISELRANISDNYDISDEIPPVSLIENGLNLLLDDGTFQEPLYFRKAIYIDAAMSPSLSYMKRTAIDEYLNYLMTSEVSVKHDEITHELVLRLGKMIKGKISLDQSDSHIHDEFHYISESGLDININEAASGIQSLATIYRLLDRGHLDNETLLLIDEPETHLHPQWVVEYARLLVLLNKKLNVKLVLASHSPDFVGAIEFFMRKYAIQEDTIFYQAKYDEESRKYDFISLDNGVMEIFESFNIALNRISEEGDAYYN